MMTCIRCISYVCGGRPGSY